MKIKTAGCFQNGKYDQKVDASYEVLSELFKGCKEQDFEVTYMVLMCLRSKMNNFKNWLKCTYHQSLFKSVWFLTYCTVVKSTRLAWQW